MALDLTLPADDTLGDAAEIRANQTALAQSLYGLNLIPNGDFLIWPTSSLPAYFSTTGGAMTITRDTGTVVRSGAVFKAVNGSGTEGFFYNSMLPTTAWHIGWRGKQIHLGCWVHSSAANSARLFVLGKASTADAVFSSFHTGGGGWEWLTLSRTLESDATNLSVGLAIGAGKTAYAWGLSAGLFGAPPQDFISPPVLRGFLYFPIPGNVDATADFMYNSVEFCKPAFILGSKATCRTAPVTSGMTWNLGKLTTAPSTYSSLYTSNLSIGATKRRGDASVYAPNAADFTTRCFNGNVTPSDAEVANTVLGMSIASGGGTAAIDARVIVEALQYQDPLASWKLAGEF